MATTLTEWCLISMIQKRLCLKIYRNLSSKVPAKAVSSLPKRNLDLPKIKVDKETVRLIEKLALVKFSDEEGIKTMEKSINFVDPLNEIDTENVEPMISLLEDRTLYLRKDVVEKTDRKEILKNASKVEDDYFVAPPGNVPFSSDSHS